MTAKRKPTLRLIKTTGKEQSQVKLALKIVAFVLLAGATLMAGLMLAVVLL